MCGRYYRQGQKQEIAERFALGKIEPGLPELLNDYNVAPTTFQPVIRNTRDGGVREMVLMRWGLVPYFAKSLADFKGFTTFNAKSESVEKAAMWREPMNRGRRCLVVANGFYEWKKIDEKTKQPYGFSMAGCEVFAFAGLWDAWKDPANGEWLQSYTILTTTPNELTEDVHTRMPVIVDEADWDEWLLREGPPPLHLLKPYPAEKMQKNAVSHRVGNVRNNDADLLNSK